MLNMHFSTFGGPLGVLASTSSWKCLTFSSGAGKLTPSFQDFLRVSWSLFRDTLKIVQIYFAHGASPHFGTVGICADESFKVFL